MFWRTIDEKKYPYLWYLIFVYLGLVLRDICRHSICLKLLRRLKGWLPAQTDQCPTVFLVSSMTFSQIEINSMCQCRAPQVYIMYSVSVYHAQPCGTWGSMPNLDPSKIRGFIMSKDEIEFGWSSDSRSFSLVCKIRQRNQLVIPILQCCGKSQLLLGHICSGQPTTPAPTSAVNVRNKGICVMHGQGTNATGP